ncbi:unnamed protein product [Amoebophrya sp. A25]|nr:unnamed protein product [Amoebophrya sp. A25]|eukprot:GSA25T00016222001.1
MIICLGPVCVPLWPVLFLALKPLWNLLPEGAKERLRSFWDTYLYRPFFEPLLDRLPPTVRGFLFYGMPSASTKPDNSKASEHQTMKGFVGTKGEDAMYAADGSASDHGSDSTNATSSSTCITSREAALKLITSGKIDRDSSGVFYPSDDSEFETLQAAATTLQTPLFVDFTASWCAPCQKLKPIFQELSSSAKKKAASSDDPSALFCVVDVDELDGVALEHGVSTLPSFRCFGGKVEKLSKSPTPDILKAFVADNID